jgi:hypothetical protein
MFKWKKTSPDGIDPAWAGNDDNRYGMSHRVGTIVGFKVPAVKCFR